MKLSKSQGVGILVMMVCLVCTLVEVCDTWDPPIQSGNDTEYALVIGALCVGAIYLFVRAIMAFQCQGFVGAGIFPFGSLWVLITARCFDFSSTDASPPSLPLRI